MNKELFEDLKTFMSIAEELINSESELPVAPRIDPEMLDEALDIKLNDAPAVSDEFKKSLRSLVLTTPRTASNRFFNQLFGGRKSKAMLGDLLAVMLNNSMYTYKVAGPQVGVEQEIIRKVCDIIGYGDQSNGTFPTGGSMSNYMAIMMARDKFDPTIRTKGVSKPLVAYSSVESHYSNAKNASFAGIGTSNVRYIETNELGEMNPEALEAQIKQDLADGLAPFYVNCTAGTTVLGAFDPIVNLSEICKKYNLWLHVDGAYSGGVIFSEKYKHLVNGLHMADSFSFNPHKMMNVPLICSIIVVKDKRNLLNSFSNEAEYLYQTDSDDFNLGKSSFQCGRRNDALKFWTLWKAVGTQGLEKIVDQQFMLSEVARSYVESNPDYTVYSHPESISICFNYKGYDPQALCTALYEESKAVVGFGTFREDTFIRLVSINSENEVVDIERFFQILEDFVAKEGHRLPKISEVTAS